MAIVVWILLYGTRKIFFSKQTGILQFVYF
jgi:hypothetical protein